MSNNLHAQIVAGLLDEWHKIDRLDTPGLLESALSPQDVPVDFEKTPVADVMRRQKSQLREVIGQIEGAIQDYPGIKDFQFVYNGELLVLEDLSGAGRRLISGLEFAYEDLLRHSGRSLLK